MLNKLRSKPIVLVIAVLAGSVIIFLCNVKLNSTQDKLSKDVPDNVYEYMIAFLDACKDTPELSSSYCHFEEDFEKEAYEKSDHKLLNYEILASDKISDNLYVFKVYFDQGWRDAERYYFVGSMDHQLNVMVNVYAIPEDMRTSISEEEMSLYTYDGKILPPDTFAISS